MSSPARKVCTPYRVPYADTDQMGVVYYGNYLTYFERSRNELIRHTVMPYKELEEKGCALPVVEAHVEYRSPAHYDDDLELWAWLDMTRGVRIRIRNEIRRHGQTLATGYTVHACLDIATGRPMRVPDGFAAAVLATEDSV